MKRFDRVARAIVQLKTRLIDIDRRSHLAQKSRSTPEKPGRRTTARLCVEALRSSPAIER
jgi:hypothetical protein